MKMDVLESTRTTIKIQKPKVEDKIRFKPDKMNMVRKKTDIKIRIHTYQ